MKKVLFRRKAAVLVCSFLFVSLVLPTTAVAQRAGGNNAAQQQQQLQQRLEQERQEQERLERERQERERRQPSPAPSRPDRERQERERQERERQDWERQERERQERERQDWEQQERERQERERQERERVERDRYSGNNGLTFTGLSKYNGYYLVASGESAGRGRGTYTAVGSLLNGGQTARISGGQATLMVLEGRDVFAYEGDDTVKFTLIIQRDPEMSSKRYVAMGEVTVTFRNGRATGTVTRFTDVGR